MSDILIQIILVTFTMLAISIAIVGIMYGLWWAMNEDVKHAVSGKEWPASRGYITLAIFVLMVISVTISVVLLKT